MPPSSQNSAPAQGPLETEPPRPRTLSHPWLDPVLSCFILLICLSIRKISDPDLGYHLRIGQWIVENRQVLRREIFTFTASNHEFIDIYWLYQVFVYSFYKLGGYGLLTLLNTGLILLAFGVLWKRLRDLEAPAWIYGPLFLLTLLASERRFQVRPEIPTWIFLGLTLWVLESRSERNRDYLFLLPILQGVWANMHGLFPLGWAVTGVYFAGQYLHTGKPDWKLLGYGGCSILASLANPYFLKGALFPFIYLRELGPGSPFQRTIYEFRSPWFLWKGPGFHPVLLAYGFFTLLLAGLLLSTFRKRKIQDYVLTGLFFYLSLQANRNMSLFMLATAPLAGLCARDLGWNVSLSGRGKALKQGAALLFSLLPLVLALRVATGAYYVDLGIPEQAGLGVDEWELPVHGAEFLAQNHLEGRILNHLNCAGWLIWKGPQKVFIDGHHEVMGEDLYEDYLSVWQPDGLRRLSDQYGIQVIFFPPSFLYSKGWTLQLSKMPDWRLVYLDCSAAVFLRDGYAPQVPALTGGPFLQGMGVSLPSPSERTALLEAPRVSPLEVFFDGFYHPLPYPRDLLLLAEFCSLYVKPDWAEPLFLEAIRRSRGRLNDTYAGLGTLYFLLHRYDDARLCVAKLLEKDPDNPVARWILGAIPPGGNPIPGNPSGSP